MKLYEIAGDILQVVEIVENGELTEAEVKDTLDALNISFKEKLEGMGRYILTLKAQVDSADAEIDRLKCRKERTKNTIASIENYILTVMESMDTKKVSCDVFDVSARKPAKVATITDEGLLPARYFIEVPATKKIDKRTLLADLKNGEIEGAELAEGKKSLTIK
jgi:hypothetical protein